MFYKIMETINKEIKVGAIREKTFYQEHIPGFVNALRLHLRPSLEVMPTAPSDEDMASSIHVPNAWAQAMERDCAKRLAQGEWSPQQHWLLSQDLARMVDILGACERILKTPIPYSYSMFMKKFWKNAKMPLRLT